MPGIWASIRSFSARLCTELTFGEIIYQFKHEFRQTAKRCECGSSAPSNSQSARLLPSACDAACQSQLSRTRHEAHMQANTSCRLPRTAKSNLPMNANYQLLKSRPASSASAYPGASCQAYHP